MSWTVFLFSMSLLTTQTTPAPTKAIKDAKSTCQVLVPADWKTDPAFSNAASDPKSTLSITVFWEPDFKVEPFTDAALKMREVEKTFENTATRIFYQTRGMQLGPNPPAIIWTAYTPASQRGACHCSISIKPGGSEQVAKSLVMTLG